METTAEDVSGPRWRPSTIAEEEDEPTSTGGDTQKLSVVYEEDMPVIVRRRGLTMTVRIFGADAADTLGLQRPRGRLVRGDRSFSMCIDRGEGAFGNSRRGLVRDVLWKGYSSVGSLDEELERRRRRSASPSSPTPSPSPTSPIKRQALLRSESPTRGVGHFRSGRSSSFAGDVLPQRVSQAFLSPHHDKRRCSVDSIIRPKTQADHGVGGNLGLSTSPHRRSLEALGLLHNPGRPPSRALSSRSLSGLGRSQFSQEDVFRSVGNILENYFIRDFGNSLTLIDQFSDELVNIKKSAKTC